MDTKAHFQKVLDRYAENGAGVPLSHEEQFCKDNKLRVVRLPNGAVVVGTYLGRVDSNYTSVNFNFNRGALDDPKGMTGLHHFYEHLVFSKKLRELSAKSYVGINGSTRSLRTGFSLFGVYNKGYKTIGVPAVMYSLLENILSPDISDKNAFENVKSTIVSEFESGEIDFDSKASEALYGTIFNKENYSNNILISGKEILNKIKSSDISKLSKSFGPKCLIASVLYEGEEKEFCELFEDIVKQVGGLKKAGSVSKYYDDPVRYDLINDVFFDEHSRRPSLTLKDCKFDHNEVKIYKFACIPFEYNSQLDFGAKLIFNFIKDQLFNIIREKGFSYYTGGTYLEGISDYLIVLAHTYEDKNNWKERGEIFEDMINDAIGYVLSKEKLFEEYLEVEKIRQLASPVFQETFLDSAISGITNWGMITDPNYVRKARQLLTVKMSQEVVRQLLDAHMHTLAFGTGLTKG